MSQKPFTDRRLEIARSLADQQGLTWTGLNLGERDALMAIAERAVKDAERVVTPITITVEQRHDDFLAFLSGDRSLWGCGKTEEHAVFNALRTHGQDAGVIIQPIHGE